MSVVRAIACALLPLSVLAAEPYQASTNLDFEDVRPFLEQVSRIVDSGLPPETIVRIDRFSAETPVDQSREQTLSVAFHGKKTELIFGVRKDDFDSPDIYFLTPDPALAEAIQQEMMAFAQKHNR